MQRSLCRAAFFLAVTTVAETTWALPSPFDDPFVELSDSVVVQSARRTTITVSARPYVNFLIAAGPNPLLFTSPDDSVAISQEAQIVASGKTDKDGRVVVTLEVPQYSSGKTYFQVMTGKLGADRRISKDLHVSTISSVAILQKLVAENRELLRGPQGETGATGPQGERGQDGAKGEKGDVGPRGEKGDIGETGLQGLPGVPGAKGERGEAGIKGDRGDTGPQGLPGAQGLKGDKGDTGAAGPQGVPGVQGLKGDTGPQGMKGDAGVAGPQGAAGLQGPKGDRGDVGPQGVAGVQGPKGDTGAQGMKGDTGAAGPQGAAGLQGPKGDRGDVGPKGDTGPMGPAPRLTCPQGWIDLGPTCLEPNFASFGTLDDALSECFQMGGRICEHQELAYACMKRDALGLNFPDNLWVHTGSVLMRTVGGTNSSFYVGYTVFRRIGNRCFGPNTINPTDAVIGSDLSGTPRNYACCTPHTFN